ncbi:MAG: hypothetical protein K8S87_05015 [Planctomycetes bacterium]|nr:hypothetical protein [Planctomycetota bacterium]
MIKHISIIMPLIIIVLSSNVSHAGDFDCQAPIMIETRGKVDFSKIILDMQIAKILALRQGEDDYIAPQTQEDLPSNTRLKVALRGPLFYMSSGIVSESRWFDRRLNWTAYDTQLNFEYKFVGLKVQAAGSDFGRDEFEFFDSRATMYFFAGGKMGSLDISGWRIGGGLSYFYSDALKGQEFLENRRTAAFFDMYFLGTQLKFVGLYDEDDFFGGGLMEIKFVNPMFRKGISATSFVGAFLNPWSALMFSLQLIFPTEYGITGAFGLPTGGDGWGWFMRWRYPLVITYERLPKAILKPGFYWGVELFWGYQAGFESNNRVTEGWEIGLRLFIFAF